MTQDELKKLEESLKKPRDTKELPDRIYFKNIDSAKEWIDNSFNKYYIDKYNIDACSIIIKENKIEEVK